MVKLQDQTQRHQKCNRQANDPKIGKIAGDVLQYGDSVGDSSEVPGCMPFVRGNASEQPSVDWGHGKRRDYSQSTAERNVSK